MLRRLLEDEQHWRDKIREALGPLTEAQNALSAAVAARDEAATGVGGFDRRIEAIEAGYRRQARHYVNMIKDTTELVARLEQQVIDAPARDKAALIRRYDAQSDWLKTLKEQMERDREQRGITRQIEALTREKEQAEATLRTATEALRPAERRVAEAQSSVDRYVALLDEATDKQLKFEADARELLAEVAPPLLQSLEVSSPSEGRRYFAEWVDPEEQERQIEEEIRVCREMIREQRDLLATVRRDFRRLEQEFIDSSERWQALNRQYIGRMWTQALSRIVLESADSISEVFVGAGGNPVAMLSNATIEAVSRVGEALYGPKPAFADFPRLPEEWIAQRNDMASENVAAEASAAFGLPVPEHLLSESTRSREVDNSGRLLGTTLAAGYTVLKDCIKTTIRMIVSDKKIRARAAQYGKLVLIDMVRMGVLTLDTNAGRVQRQAIRALHQFSKAQRASLMTKMINRIKSKAFKKEITKSLLFTAGKLVVKEGIQYKLDQRRAETFAAMFQEEMVWYQLRRDFHFAGAQVRFERMRLQVLREILRELISELGTEMPNRIKKIRTDETCAPGAVTFTLRFSRRVRDVRVEIPTVETVPAPSASDDGKTHTVRVELPENPSARRLRVRVEATDILTEKKLDSDPFTQAVYDPPNNRWAGYEAGTDSNHSPRVREGRDGVSMVFLIDGSGSMAEEGRIQQAKASAKRILQNRDSIREGDEVALWHFYGGSPSLVLGFTTNYTAMARAVDNLGADGSTPLARSISAAGSYLLRRGQYTRKVLVVLSDGVETDGGSPTLEIERLRRHAVEIQQGGR